MDGRREKLIKDMQRESSNIQARVLVEYDFYNSYLNSHPDSSVEEYVEYRCRDTFTNSRISNKIYNLRKMFGYIGIPVEKYLRRAADRDISKAYCTLEYIRDVSLTNPSDRLILLFYFLNIQGEYDCDLRNIRIEDIDLNDRVMIVGGYEIMLDDEIVYSIVSEVIDSIKPAYNSHIVKVKRTRRNKNVGIASYGTMCSRLRKINEELGKSFSRTTLKISGSVRLLLKENPGAIYWEQRDISHWVNTHCDNTVLGIDVYNALIVIGP